MKKIRIILLCLLSGLASVSCGNKSGDLETSADRAFDEKKVLPLYENKGPWTPGPKHGDALVGSLKYGPDFTHFDYVNVNAPVNGMLTLAARTKFDSFNPYILKGTPAPGISLVIFETLMTSSYDEPAAQYGLLAESIEYPQDKSSVCFTLRPEAKWHDGKPVTVEDVLFSFEVQMTKGVPTTAQYYADVDHVEKTGPRAVTFFLKPKSNPELPHILGQLAVLPKHYFETHDFAQPLREPPVGSGPYRIKEFSMGRSIVYERDPTYWGWHLALNKGQYNFQYIKYIIYLDEEAQFLGFKAGEYDFRDESSASRWTSEYKGPLVDSGEIKRALIPDDSPQGMQANFFNTRRDTFKDRRVREALACVFDFEWMNKVLFYNSYKRSKSFFENSVFASYLGGLPSEDEKKLLLPFKDEIPPEVLTAVYEPPKTDGSGNLRENHKKALELLRQAGWEVKDGKLVNTKDGKQMSLEYIFYDSRTERIVAPFVENLKKLGLNATYRKLDPTQWVQRVEQFDYDMMSYPLGQSFSPGNEQRYFWSAQAADTSGSFNFAGIKNPAVDFLIEAVISARNFNELKTATRALDRVLLWNFYVIPEWYLNYHRIAYKKTLVKPDSDTPLFVPIYEGVCQTTWWMSTGAAASQ